MLGQLPGLYRAAETRRSSRLAWRKSGRHVPREGQRPLGGTGYEYTAGAFCSLTWNGKQFIDAKDHGRCLQSAVPFNGLGEQWNPTEAGSSSLTDPDLPGPSSSKLLNYAAGPERAATSVQMAYWYPVNGRVLSNHILRKYVRLIGNVISYKVEFASVAILDAGIGRPHTDCITGVRCGGDDRQRLQLRPAAAGSEHPGPGVVGGEHREFQRHVSAEHLEPRGTELLVGRQLAVGTLQDVIAGLQQVYDRSPLGY